MRQSTIRKAFLLRSKTIIERIAATASEEALAAALAAATDVGTLARALGDPEIVGAAITAIEPLVPAIARNAEHRQELLKEGGGVLSASEVAKLLGIQRQAVDKRRANNRLLAFRRAGDWQYPQCQFYNGEVIEGLTEVLHILAGRDPFVTLDFLITPDSALIDMSPLEALKTNIKWHKPVMRLARGELGDTHT